MNRAIAGRLSVFGLIFLAGCASSGTSTTPQSMWALEATPLDRTASELENSTTEHLAWAKALRRQIQAVYGPRNVENTLVPYNQMMMHLEAASSECSLFARVHPEEDVRTVAAEGERKVARYLTELSLGRDLYEALKAMDRTGADPATRYLVKKELRDFHRAGVDKPEDVRARIRRLNEEIVRLGRDFAKNIRDDEREILLESPADLDGLPRDWIAKHQPGSDGKIHVSTRCGDYVPFMTYAHGTDARLKLYREFKNRGYPKNIEVLNKLLAKRHELAQLLGYAHWADYMAEDMMIGTAANAQSFLDWIAENGAAAAERDYALLLERKRKDVPRASKIEEWERSYYENLVMAEQHAFDAQAVRPYLNFPDVRQGLFDLTSRLFGIRFVRVLGLDLWHDDVTAWDVYDGNKRLGRFYLDLYPRKNKCGRTACFGYREGVEGLRLPQAVLVGNFPDPRGSKDGLALMEHKDVVVLFREFGRLLHTVFAGHQRWIGNGGISTEWDFAEAPSQMLEEWCYNVEALRMFAKHHKTGKPIPVRLVEKLRRAADFGKGVDNAHQVFYSALSLDYYRRDPGDLDTDKLLIRLQDQYSPFDYVDGTHFQCGFAQLDDYPAVYYAHRWSLMIAKDLFSEFEQNGVLNAKTGRRFRKLVLEPGGSKPAAELIKDFLGRPYSFEAFKTWLNRT